MPTDPSGQRPEPIDLLHVEAESSPRRYLVPLLLTLGLIAFGVASLSIADLMVPRPFDGVVLDKRTSDVIRVREVIPGSGADRAGIRAGDEIVGIGRSMLRDEAEAEERIGRFRIGERVPYLVRRDGVRVQELTVELGTRHLGDGPYFFACALGFAFFFVGIFVLVRQPGLLASQVFFLLGCLFLLFLVCRLRPVSYSGVDSWILSIGTLAFVLLPPAFLHFYVLFPRPAWLHDADRENRLRPLVWLFRRGWLWLYLMPPMAFGLAWLVSGKGRGERWFGGAPTVSWWLLGLSVVLGILSLVANAHRLRGTRERRGVTLVLVGSVVGLLPFAIASVLVPIYQEQKAFLYYGLLPLALVPITFTYAIVRFQLLDIRIILRRSLLYTVVTALVTMVYAGGIATFNAFFAESYLATSGFFPVILALAIVVLFDPIRRRVQRFIDREFFAERSRLQRALEELGEAMTAQLDLQDVVRDLVERLPQILGFRFAALYLHRGLTLERMAGPGDLPENLAVSSEMQRYLRRRKGVVRLDQLGALPLRSTEVAELSDQLQSRGIEAAADLSSRRRHLGMVLFSDRPRLPPLEEEERYLLDRLLDQASLALETGLLLEERTQKAELEREMQIAASIQAQLLPKEVRISDGFEVAAECLPARIIGGDFFSQLPSSSGDGAIIYGDVSGKSVSGAMMMMAAHEALYSLALAVEDQNPERLFELANRRIYGLGRRSFVALGYFADGGSKDCGGGEEAGMAESEGGRCLRYLVAGQPPPMLRRADGTVIELPLPEYRIPVGAMPRGDYRSLEVWLRPGDLLLAYSDGVTDARSPDGEFFGEERLQEVLAKVRTGRPQDLVSEVLWALEAFARGSLLYDDVTLLALAPRSSASTEARSRIDREEESQR